MTRLVDGPNQYSGRVEVYRSNRDFIYGSIISPQQWYTICDTNQWTVQDATVVCRSLGYSFKTANLQINQSYGLGTGPILTASILCLGTENYIWDCPLYHNERSICNHNMDRGITCSGKPFVYMRYYYMIIHFKQYIYVFHFNCIIYYLFRFFIFLSFVYLFALFDYLP